MNNQLLEEEAVGFSHVCFSYNNILHAQNGAKLENIEVSSERSVIPEGALHKNKHDDFEIDVTKKGIPVITVADDNVETLEEIQEQKDSVVQHAEIEHNEIIFSKELTDFIEEKRKEWHETEDKDILLEVGKRLVKEIIENTDDNTGLIDKMDKFEEGGVFKMQQGNQIFTRDNLRNQFSAIFTQQQVDNMNKFYNYFSGKGWNDNQIFALMGNIMQESHFNPTLTNQSGAYGYYQFKGDRLKDYQKWIANNGYKDGGLSQTEYIDYIMANGIDPRYDYYQRLQNNINNGIDVEKSKAEIDKFKTKYWVKDLNAAWRNPNSSLQNLVDLFGYTIEAAGSELNLPQRYKYANGFATIKSKYK